MTIAGMSENGIAVRESEMTCVCGSDVVNGPVSKASLSVGNLVI